MLVDLVHEIWWKCLFRKPTQQQHPVVELTAIFIVSHSCCIPLDDFDEGTHNLREENNTKEHEDDANELFSRGYWKEISITNC